MKKINANDSDSSLYAYLEEIGRYKLLSFEEELEFSRRIEEGDEEAKHALVNANLRLVVRIAKTFLNNDIGLMDLIQEGNLGLMRAAEKYDYRRNVKFSTYSSWWIKQSISRAMANKRRLIRLPHRKEEIIKKIIKIKDNFIQEYFRHPTLEELALHSGIQENQVLAVLEMVDGTMSLDMEIGNENGTLLDILEDYSFSPDRQFEEKATRKTVEQFLNNLRKREKDVLMYRFAFHGGKKYTLKKIGEVLGISPETVRQVELKALRKLRTQVEPVREYLYD